ncbi:hypothetical protein D1007_11424 [Hordeum vulgare]|nr:hypothetical protein D1007_11424 [Hordeum vulgare]
MLLLLALVVVVASGHGSRWKKAKWWHTDGTEMVSSQLGRAHQMDKIVNIHYFDKEAFMNVDIVDKYEEVLIFLESPTYEEVVEETRIRLKWVDPSEQDELLGRYDVGSAHKCRMKTMPIKSNLHWVAYKDVVAYSVVKSLEVFESMVVKAPLFHVDLNQTLVDDLSLISSVPPIVEPMSIPNMSSEVVH